MVFIKGLSFAKAKLLPDDSGSNELYKHKVREKGYAHCSYSSTQTPLIGSHICVDVAAFAFVYY